ncbi:MAG: DUF2784 domain-containing protein [Kiritimatiellae bacterium]|nr:DUF2784 domain-containing protein [Kiritimatiellia bacterium]MDW8458570.1 DUF2784 domain-containing protein [Verrucomicrobiota bacterium]
MSDELSADILLVLHAMIPLFILGGIGVVALGAFRRWRWIRNPWFRSIHAGLMGIVLLQALLGRLCPLTVWEHELRVRAGQVEPGAPKAFIPYWTERLLYHDLPQSWFVVAYAITAALIVGLWFAVPPRPFKGRKDQISESSQLAK